MKKILLAILLSTITITGVAADIKLVKFDVTITKDGKTITQTSLITKDGQVTPIESFTEHPYRAQVSRGDDGKVHTTPGTIKAGFSASFKPDIKKNGEIDADVLIDISDLTSMKNITSGDGLTIDMPEVGQTHVDQKVTFTSDVPVVLNSGGYTIKVLARSI